MSLYIQVIFHKGLHETSTEAPKISLLILDCTQHTVARLCFQLTEEPQLFFSVSRQPWLSELVDVPFRSPPLTVTGQIPQLISSTPSPPLLASLEMDDLA